MIHLLQSFKDGKAQLVDAPVPQVSGSSLLVSSRASIISMGTERSVVDFGRASWFQKARANPDKVRKVIGKVLSEGIGSTMTAVHSALETPIPLGYCQAGIVVEIGDAVSGFRVGDRVVTNGPHAEYVRVPHTLAARIPDNVTFEHAAFTPLAAIGLQGLRLAAPTLGEVVVVYGLGLIGLLTVQVARAAGCRVIGIDRSAKRCQLAAHFGALPLVAADGVDVVEGVRAMSRGVGADIVLLTLAASSDEPIHLAAGMSRKRGRIVLIGVTGLAIRRDDFYRKELSFQVSCSYGPGRYDPTHEDNGVDYPLPYVRWTEGRNFDAVLALMSEGKIDPAPLVSHRVPIERANDAYDLVAEDDSALGIVLEYRDKGVADHLASRTVHYPTRSAPSGGTGARLGVIGAGSFAKSVLIPAFRKAGATLEGIASAGGVSGAVAARQYDAHRATSDAASLIGDDSTDAVVIATRHDTHANWTARALRAGKHVFVEKPLALTHAQLAEVADSARSTAAILCVGFNRRFAPHVQYAKELLAGRRAPLALTMTVNAGAVPHDHWTVDPTVGGGRIIGECCHFIDLARFFVGSSIKALQVTCAKDPSGESVQDLAMLNLEFADGSIASIQYLANGNKSYPKERFELFFDGNILSLENYRRIRGWGIPARTSRWPSTPDKGHVALATSFVSSIRTAAAAPIPLEEVLEVSWWAIEAGRLAAEGGGSVSGRPGAVETT